MAEKEEQFLLKNFSRYYEKAHIGVERIGEREFGMGGRAKKIEVRHMAFGSNEELRNSLVGEPPFYVSYSTAFYERPAGRPMEKKGWKSAQVVFDIDAHHEGELFVCDKCLQWAKDNTLRLVEDFLVPDFGLKREELELNFSGNRGYHVHVRNETFERLTRDERKELTDYITGTGFDANKIYQRNTELLEIDQNNRSRWVTKRKLELSSIGWRHKIFVALFDSDFYGVVRPKMVPIVKKVVSKGNWKLFFDELQVKFGKANVDTEVRKLINECIKKKSISIETDAGVTTDISRLIRLPNSIHGASGLIAKKIPFASLQKFNPLDDAVVFGSNELEVVPSADLANIHMKGQTYSFEKGKKAMVPGYLAVYLLCKETAMLA